jgi:hypothetical protein
MSEANGTGLHVEAPPDAAAAYQRERLQDGRDCLAAALDYLALGWAVTCCCPPDHAGVGKTHAKGCTSPGKAPLHIWKPLQQQRPSAEEVKSWWRLWPTANVGMALGRGSCAVRIDLEGPEALTRLQELAQGDLPRTLEFASGRMDGSGRGLLYALPAGLEAKTTSEGLALGGELRLQGEGAQTVLPPSRHKSGGRYVWAAGHGPTDIAMAPAPAWLLEALQQPRGGRASAQGSVGSYRDLAAPVREGGRHTYLVRLAGIMRGRGMSVAAITAALLAENAACCDPPLDDGEVLSIVASAAGWEQGPRPFAGEPDSRRAAVIIRDYWQEKNDFIFRRGALLYSRALGRERSAADLLRGAGSDLVDRLGAALEVPRDPETGLPVRSRIPGVFKIWAPTAYQDILQGLPDETPAAEIAEPAREEFRHRMAAALLSLTSIGRNNRVAGEAATTEVELRPAIQWADLFAKASRWGDVRGRQLWAMRGADGVLRVAIRAGLMGQLHAQALAALLPERLADLCEMYDVGRRCKVLGGDMRAIELESDFVQDLLAKGAPANPENQADGQTDSKTYGAA